VDDARQSTAAGRGGPRPRYTGAMRLSGWALTGWIAVALLAASAAVLAGAGVGEEGVRAWIRLTARTSLALFLVVFVARPLRQL